ncbi:MAG: helix-turn-helix transcriptional regulator [Desulfosudaceae bacterium]
MPKKRSERTHGEKVIMLFAELYFSGQRRSLIELSEKLGCSKQTVQRLVDQITQAYNIPIEHSYESRRIYYQIRRPKKLPRNLSLSASELSMLQMCQAFTRHLLGKKLLEDSERAIQKSSTLAAGGGGGDHYGCFLPGTIDYTPHQEDIRRLVKAMDQKRVCRIVYKNPAAKRAKTFYIKPYKLFSYNNALYLHAGMARSPGARVTQFAFDPLLAVHRLREVDITERKFTFPADYDFEKHFNQEFGVIKQEGFTVQVELRGYAAVYAEERQLSPDQYIQKKNNRLILTFTASSEPEVVAWILAKGDEARVLSPDWLVEEIRNSAAAICRRYE